MLSSYDPNITWAEHRVRVTLMQWGYKAVLETTVKGNCKGFEIFDSAIDGVYSELPKRDFTRLGDEVAYVILSKNEYDKLEIEDEMLDYEDWVKEMVVAIEIISVNESDDI